MLLETGSIKDRIIINKLDVKAALVAVTHYTPRKTAVK